MEWGAITKTVLAALSSKKGRNTTGWIVVAVLSPIILAVALLCSLGTGTSQHNNAMVQVCFYNGSFSDDAPDEYAEHIAEMQEAFATLDSKIFAVNSETECAGLDPNQVKAVFYVLCFDDGAPSSRAAGRFVNCFYTTETRTMLIPVETSDEEDEKTETKYIEEEYTVNVLLPMSEVYDNLASLFGITITDEQIKNIDDIYCMISGDMGNENFGGSYERGSDRSNEIDISGFTDSATKNAHDLVAYAVQAWENGWGYVWGSHGNVLTNATLSWMLDLYPEGVGNYEDFIRAHWLGRRTADCIGLIKGYGWLDAETLEIKYGTNGMPDIGANQMYYNAVESGTIDTMPDIPGIAVWHRGHIGIYIGNGEVIEAMGTKYGVVKTQIYGRGWTHWLKVPYINYD